MQQYLTTSGVRPWNVFNEIIIVERNEMVKSNSDDTKDLLIDFYKRMIVTSILSGSGVATMANSDDEEEESQEDEQNESISFKCDQCHHYTIMSVPGSVQQCLKQICIQENCIYKELLKFAGFDQAGKIPLKTIVKFACQEWDSINEPNDDRIEDSDEISSGVENNMSDDIN